MINSSATAAAAISCLLASAASAGGVTVFSGTGAAFVADPDTSLPTQQPTITGDSADWFAPINDQILAIHTLAPAMTYQCASASVTVTCEMNLTRLSDDFDPVFLVADGLGAIGGQVGDNPSGSARVIVGTIAGDFINVSSDPFMFQGAGFPPIGGSLDATIEVTLDAAETSVRVAFGALDMTTTVGATLDRQAELSFLLVANAAVGTGEFYRINTITLSIDSESACAEDVDGDGDVDFADLNTLLGEFNTSGAKLEADVDCDGDVDFADLNRVLGVFNTEC